MGSVEWLQFVVAKRDARISLGLLRIMSSDVDKGAINSGRPPFDKERELVDIFITSR